MSKLRFRQIHLDFHTGPAIPDVGKDFDAKAFAARMKAAHVNSVTVFAKCHHGHLYYNTKHPARHPGLKRGLDLLGRQVEALHSADIRAPIYISVQCDEYSGTAHPEWLAIQSDGAQFWGGPLSATWHILDMSSPYADYLAEQIEEVCRLFKPVDGIFLDMCWDQPSCSKWALAGMAKKNLNPESEADRQTYAHQIALGYMARYRKLIDGRHGGKPVNIAFNSRPLSNLVEEAPLLRHVEIEALPSGGWGYMFFPIHVRFARTFGHPTLGMTARFHKSWADFGGYKPEAALMYECCQMIAQGAACSVGDQLPPRGELDKASYELISKVYRHIEACEPWCDGAVPQTDIGVIFTPDDGLRLKPGGANEGVTRALVQLKQQFDFIPPTADLRRFKLVILPESVRIDAPLARKLKAHLKAGGSLLVCGAAALDADGKPALVELGVTAHGASPFSTTYMRLDGAIQEGLAVADHVVYERSIRLKSARGAKVLGRVVEPYFERTWEHFSSHFQTPGDKLSPWAVAVEKKTGRGTAITIAFPIFTAYATHGNLPYRHLLAKAIARLHPEPLLQAGGPSFLEASLLKQGQRSIVHLLSFAPQRRTQHLDLVEEPTPMLNVPVSLKLSREPSQVYLAPEREPLAFTYRDGRAEVKVSSARGQAMVVFE